MNLELLYSRTSEGMTDYFMTLNGKTHLLNEVPSIGTQYDVRLARKAASDILRKEVADIATRIGLEMNVQLARFRQIGAT